MQAKIHHCHLSQWSENTILGIGFMDSFASPRGDLIVSEPSCFRILSVFLFYSRHLYLHYPIGWTPNNHSVLRKDLSNPRGRTYHESYWCLGKCISPYRWNTFWCSTNRTSLQAFTFRFRRKLSGWVRNHPCCRLSQASPVGWRNTDGCDTEYHKPLFGLFGCRLAPACLASVHG